MPFYRKLRGAVVEKGLHYAARRTGEVIQLSMEGRATP